MELQEEFTLRLCGSIERQRPTRRILCTSLQLYWAPSYNYKTNLRYGSIARTSYKTSSGQPMVLFQISTSQFSAMIQHQNQLFPLMIFHNNGDGMGDAGVTATAKKKCSSRRGWSHGLAPRAWRQAYGKRMFLLPKLVETSIRTNMSLLILVERGFDLMCRQDVAEARI